MENPNYKSVEQNENPIVFKDLFYLCLSKWKWFVLSVAVMLALGVLYTLRTHPVYSRTASVLVKQDAKGNSMPTEMDAFSNLGLFTTRTNVYNELLTMQSPALMTQVVRNLSLNRNYYAPGRFYNQVLYGRTLPATVSFLDLDETESAGFLMDIGKDMSLSLSNFTLMGAPVDFTLSGRMLDTLESPVGRIIVSPTINFQSGKEYTVKVVCSSISSAVGAYCKKVTMSLKDKQASVIAISINDLSIQRADDVLNEIVNVYNENWIFDKNQISVSTSLFINDRLAVIENELGSVDERISSYKSEHLVPDVQAASSLYMQQSTTTNREITELNNSLSMAKYVRDYVVNEDNNYHLLPANSGIGSNSIESEIMRYNEQVLQRNSLVANSSEKNPLVIDMNEAISAMRTAILKSINNQIVTLESKIKSLEKEERKATSQIAANPNQAKYLLSVERQQKVKEALYLFLLQKREENELSQAFTAFNTRLITPPTGSTNPIAPQRAKILLIAILIGLVIPFGIIYLAETLNTTVR
ncbi:MAG: chromosome partitioning protein ParA, partial [Bacteroidales bacterium]|nr:chromosome partitioning protein ParA [Bacteroidales bacterium]